MWMNSTAKMRERTNTNLSVSSTESTASTSTRSGRSSFNEKRYSSPPPLSPSLPAPVTKENRPRQAPRRTLVWRGFVALCGLLLIWRYVLGCWPYPSDTDLGQIDSDSELVGGSNLPDEPTTLMVPTPDGRSRWTVSIPHNYSFPLTPHDYKDICANGVALRDTINDNSSYIDKHWRYGHAHTKDRTFLDIEAAEKTGILPASKQKVPSTTCDTSMTFVLESDEASFGKSLLLLWLSYGLAKKEGRAFFIDDTRWAWGSYTSYFAPPAVPTCTPPPRHHIVPCPRNAKHLVVSSATAAWTFGEAFHTEFQKASRRKHGLATQSRIYNLLRTGYEELFKLNGDDAVYAAERIAELKQQAVVGMQIRRGDRHPYEFQYSRDYLPLERYADAAKAQLRQEGEGLLLVASDDPDIPISSDLQLATSPLPLQRAQERILLATKATLDQSSSPSSRSPSTPYTKFLDENSGWEGGFYSALFYSMGGGSSQHDNIPAQALQLRELVGRAYLLDMAVLAGASSDGVVCAVSSSSCRALGVMMGWDAMKRGKWRNVDDGREWSWDGGR